MAIYRKYLRYSDYSRLRHSKRFRQFLARKSSDFSGSGTGTDFNVDLTVGSEAFTATGHGFSVGDGPFVVTATGSMSTNDIPPAPLQKNVHYFIRTVPSTRLFTLSLTPGGTIIRPTGSSTATTNTITPATSQSAVYELLRSHTARIINAADDIDDFVG